jgi:hypothetical protein
MPNVTPEKQLAPSGHEAEVPQELARLRHELAELRAENARLRAQNWDLRIALDAHVARARSTGLYGPIEMSAGTCVGPRRRRDQQPRGG